MKNIQLKDLLKEPTRNGLTKPKAIRGNGVKMISMREIFSHGRIADIEMDRVPVSDKELSNCQIEKGDLLFARQSLVLDGAGKCSIVTKANEPTVFESHLIRARIDEKKANPYFLYYYFNSRLGKDNMRTIVEQVAAAGIRGSDLINLWVPSPSIEVQNRLADILITIDKKIELNYQINDNLYAQAKATTKQWISKSTGDYELLPLSDIASINPDTYSPKETWKYVNYLDTSSITEGCIAEIQHITPSSEKLPSRARRKIAPNDIVFSTVRPNQRHYGIISEPLPNMLGSTGFAVIRSKNPLVCNELIYLCLTENEFIEKMQQLAEQSTSTFPSIKPSDLGVCKIPCPKDQSSTSFTETLKSLFALIAANQRENISLSEIRDALLPKLMSGEIDVSDIQL